MVLFTSQAGYFAAMSGFINGFTHNLEISQCFT